jgi:hypothetical protein
MAIINPQPPVIDGLVYDKLGVSIAQSTNPKNGEMVLDISVTFFPYRDGPNGPEILQEGRTSMVFADAVTLAGKMAQKGNLSLARFLAAQEAAAQAFINANV